MPESNLFNEFADTSSTEWKQRIIDELKGSDFVEKLVWESPEGIKVKPFYHSDDLKDFRRFSNTQGGWEINQSIFVGNEKEANLKALSALKKGAESIRFMVPHKKVEFEKLIQGIDTKATKVHFDFQFLEASYYNEILDFYKDEVSTIYLNLDCIGHLVRTGNWFFSEEKDFEILKSVKRLDSKNVLSVDATLYQNAGANIIQQLAYSLAHANEYFTRELVNSSFNFRVSVGANYFFEIAKLRALRWLFETLAQEYDFTRDCHIIVEPTKRNKTIYDYNSNMLRTTTECMAAILGRADSVCNLPYDSVYREPNEFAERIARNQLLILKDESYFSKVYNPADGSYYIESLTKEFAEEALKMFKEIEAKGGFIKLLKEGTIQKEIAESSRIEQEGFDKQEIVLVGSNVFQNSDDRMKSDLNFNPFKEKEPGQTTIEPITESRLSSSLEQKRLEDE